MEKETNKKIKIKRNAVPIFWWDYISVFEKKK